MLAFDEAVEILIRMCDRYREEKGCVGCPLESVDECTIIDLYKWYGSDLSELSDIIENWDQTHPPITNAMKFEEVFGVAYEDVSDPEYGIAGSGSSWADTVYTKPLASGS